MILDIILVVVILGGAFLGYKKGLVGIAVSLISIILSLVLGFILQGTVANMLYNDTGLGKKVEQTVYETMNSENKEEDAKSSSMYDNIVSNIIGNAKETFTNEQTAKAVTMYILRGISFIIIVIVVFLICYILQMVLNLVFDLPILNSINKYGGLAAGFVKALIKIYIVLAICSFLAPVPVMKPVIEYIDKSVVTSILYNNNLFVLIINKTLKI